MKSISEVFQIADCNNTINSLYLCKVGSFAINKVGKDISPPEEIINALFNSSFVCTKEKPRIDPEKYLSTTHKQTSIYFGFESHKFDIKIPKSEQKYHNSFGVPSNFESFNALVSGTMFMCYQKVDKQQGAYIAHEFRELAKKSILTSESLNFVEIGPSPIHPDIYVTTTNSSQNGALDWKVHKLKDGNIVIEIVNGKSEKIDAYLKKIFTGISNNICDFYKNILMASSCKDLER